MSDVRPPEERPCDRMEKPGEPGLAQERAQDRADHYADLFHSAPVAYLVLDESGTIEEANAAAAERLGAAPEELRGVPLSRYVCDTSHDAFAEHISAAFSSGQRLEQEFLLQPVQGRPFHARIECLASQHDGVKQLRCVLIDIDKRKAVEEELRSSHERLRLLFELSQEGIIVVGPGRMFRQANPAACAILGYPADTLLGMSLNDLQTPPGHLPTSERYGGQATRGPLQGEFTFVRPDGETRTVEFSARSVPDGLHMAFMRDVTDRKRAEEQLRQYSEHLEELVELRAERIRDLERRRSQSEQLAATGRMAARIAHEINNPLAGIKNSFLLVKDAVPEDYPYFRYVAAIEKEIDRIARIVSQMFDLYQPEREVPLRFGLKETVEDVILMLEPLSRQRQVTVTVRLPEYPLILFLPEGLVRQVLYNLIANAIEASPPEGVVRVAAVPLAENVSIAVTDHGAGISEEAAAHLFEPFFTTKKAGFEEGVGLGLSVSRTLVELMQGTLSYQSKVGEGTIFRVLLPQSLRA